MAQIRFPVTAAGLAVPVWIGLPGQSAAPLLAAGGTITAPVQARGLLDTGTDVTVVAPWILQRLAVPLVTATSTRTVGGQVRALLYRVSLGVTDPSQPPGAPWMTASNLLVMELTTVLPDLDVLIGLDALLQHKLVIDGPAKQFWLEV